MGFPSPAADYVEVPLTVEMYCEVNASSLVIETSTGCAVVEPGRKRKSESILLATLDGRNYFGKWMGTAFITEEGEAIEGEALDELIVIGVVTFVVTTMWEDDGAA